VKRVLVVLLLAALACGAPPAPPPPPEPPGPDLEVPAEVHLGRTVAGATVSGTLAVRALRDTEVVGVETTCECTTAQAELPRSLRAGETLAIPVTVDLQRVSRGGFPEAGTSGPGKVRRSVIVRTASGRLESAVTVDVSEFVRLEPPVLDFEQMGVSGTARGTVRVVPAAGVAVPDVVSLEPSEPTLRARARPETDGVRLDVEWTPEGRGPREARLLVGLDRPEDPVVPVVVRVDLVSPVQVRPERIENVQASLSRPVVARLVVDRLDGRDLDIRRARSDNHRVMVEVLPGSGARREVQVVIPVPQPPAEATGRIDIETSVKGAERVIVPFRVRAAG
jgi:hypothetical protein